MGVAFLALALQANLSVEVRWWQQRDCAVCGGHVTCGAHPAAEGGVGLWHVFGRQGSKELSQGGQEDTTGMFGDQAGCGCRDSKDSAEGLQWSAEAGRPAASTREPA